MIPDQAAKRQRVIAFAALKEAFAARQHQARQDGVGVLADNIEYAGFALIEGTGPPHSGQCLQYRCRIGDVAAIDKDVICVPVPGDGRLAPAVNPGGIQATRR